MNYDELEMEHARRAANAFHQDDARLARMHGYEPWVPQDWRRWPPFGEWLPEAGARRRAAFKRAYATVRREVWDRRESVLRPGKDWPSYG